MKYLVAESLALVFFQLGDLLERGRILSNKSAPLKKSGTVGKANFIGKVFDILEKRLTRNTSERVLNTVVCS